MRAVDVDELELCGDFLWRRIGFLTFPGGLLTMAVLGGGASDPMRHRRWLDQREYFTL